MTEGRGTCASCGADPCLDGWGCPDCLVPARVHLEDREGRPVVATWEPRASYPTREGA